jgi:hypothetical protein
MILRGVLFALGFAAGIGFLIWKIVKTEVSIMKDDAYDFVELKTSAGGDALALDEMLLRANHIAYITRRYEFKSGAYLTICVAREQLEKARLALGKQPVGE